jgi:putative transcriptional regulator
MLNKQKTYSMSFIQEKKDKNLAVWSSDCTVIFYVLKHSGRYGIITLINFITTKVRDENMKVSYNGLWKILIDKNMNKKDLSEKVGLAPATVSKMGRGEFVSMDVLYRIGTALDVDFGDLVSMKVKQEDK